MQLAGIFIGLAMWKHGEAIFFSSEYENEHLSIANTIPYAS